MPCLIKQVHVFRATYFVSFLSKFNIPLWQGGFILDMGVHFMAGLRMVTSDI